MRFIVSSIICTSFKTLVDFGGYFCGFVNESTSQTQILRKINPTHIFVVCFEFLVSLFICICWIMSTKVFFNQFSKFSINNTFHLQRFFYQYKTCCFVVTITTSIITIINWYRLFNNICLSFALIRS
jgi:hypothetical protein